MVPKPVWLIAGLMLVSLLWGCEGPNMSAETISQAAIGRLSDVDWQRLSGKSIYFGHMSVGKNIMDGVAELLRHSERNDLKVIETTDAAVVAQGVWIHSKIGQNGYPKTKVDDFVRRMHNGFGNKVNVAFFKFCYVDIRPETDIEEIFTYYRERMEALKRQMPGTRFVHVTVPLKVVQRGPKAWVKKIIGRPIGGYAGNIKRNRYNALLKEYYRGREPIFDLAGAESTAPNGGREIFSKDGQTYYALIPGYSHDRRHLNEPGRSWVAAQLLMELARIK